MTDRKEKVRDSNGEPTPALLSMEEWEFVLTSMNYLGTCLHEAMVQSDDIDAAHKMGIRVKMINDVTKKLQSSVSASMNHLMTPTKH